MSAVSQRELSESEQGQAPQKVFKCGWLEKRGRINKGFKKRWFILKKATLEYYKTHQKLGQGIDPQGIILIAEGIRASIPPAADQMQSISG